MTKFLDKKISVWVLYILTILPNIYALAIWFPIRDEPSKLAAAVPNLIFIILVDILLVTIDLYLMNEITFKPLYRLASAAEQIAEGNLQAPIGFSGNEDVQLLSRSFDKIRQMTADSYGVIRKYTRQLEDRIKELNLLMEIDSAILSGQNLDSIFGLITEKICELFGADYCCVTMLDNKGFFQIKSMYGFSSDESLRLKKALIGKVIDKDFCPAIKFGDVVSLADIKSAALSENIKHIYAGFEIKSVLSAPLINEGHTVGSINVWYKNQCDFDGTIVDRLKLFAEQTSIAVNSAMLSEGNRKLSLDIIKSLANAIDARDKYTANHSARVSQLSVALAQELGLSQKEVQTIECAGLLHDIGKIGIDERVLNKPDKLTMDEMEAMKQHAVISAEIIRPIKFLEDVVPIVLHHHEWFNGLGYPSGLSGSDIPLGARILAVADALEAITSDRPYRKAMSLHQGAIRLKDTAGIQFDPVVVKAMIRVIERIEFIQEFDSVDKLNSCEYSSGTDDLHIEDAL
ncbi:MAG: HD domain-containing protein [Firmicutes bacterium]|nr:HD domain-containing protein [Bacillota bacterium]